MALTPGADPRIAVLVVAYNAQDTLATVLDRIPGDFAARIASVIVCDDASTDATHDVATTYQRGSRLPLTIVRLNQSQTAYQAALQSAANIMRISLLDYIR